ncbi:MAG: hypothetical protein PHP28_12345 [Actinomycetota bacterium]|nr:hypothetical protein [Actinomycetota bacterium]MDD5667381.1 hypothetical protein [Actinomycetota bacterium]
MKSVSGRTPCGLKIKKVGVEEWAAGGPPWYSAPRRIKVEKGE